jgi:hypothetical protein
MAVRNEASVIILAADARLGKAADADKDLAALDALAKVDPNPQMASKRMAFAHGLVALAKKDAKGAAAAMADCDADDMGCGYERFFALSKAGDTAGAEEVRKHLTTLYLRNGGAVYVIGKLGAPGGAAAPAGKTPPARMVPQVGKVKPEKPGVKGDAPAEP